MEIAALEKKYDGVLRYVFVKHLHKEGDEWEVEQIIPMQDTKAQQKLFEKGWLACSVL